MEELNERTVVSFRTGPGMGNGLQTHKKVYVVVTAMHTVDGTTRPVSILYEDGDGLHTYRIDRVLDVRRAAATKVGGTGMRYTILVNGKQTFLYEDEGRWFVEAKRSGA